MSVQPQDPRAWIQNHIRLYQTDPEKAHLFDFSFVGVKEPMPTLLLTTTGRKSGRPIPTPLIYSKAGDAFVVIGSKGGAPSHPDWYLNLVATPACEIQVARDHYLCVARTVTDEAERGPLWAQMAQLYPPYDDYQRSAGARKIPVVVLDPQG